MRRMSNFGHFLSPGGGAMSLTEFQHMNGFRAGLFSPISLPPGGFSDASQTGVPAGVCTPAWDH